MLRIPVISLFLSALSVSYCFAQIAIPQLAAADVPDGTITRTEQYDGESLWGYIDGGADLYLEYGFTNLLAQEIQWHNRHFRIDCYQMKDPAAAYGIFSVSHRRCTSIDSLSLFNCTTLHQLQLVHGKFYLSIVNDSGTIDEQAMNRDLARIMLRKMGENRFKLPPLFDDTLYTFGRSNVKYIEGPLGFQNGYPDWEVLFDGLNDYSCYILPIETGKGSAMTAQITFFSESDREYFCRKVQLIPPEGTTSMVQSADRIYRAVRFLSSTKLLYFESDLQPDARAPYIRLLNKVQ